MDNSEKKSTTEDAWDDVARQINEHGPPERSGFEWRKIWPDLKWRTKKKVFENSKIINSGEGSGRFLILTDLEQSVDKLLGLSAASAEYTYAEPPKDSTLEDDLNELLNPGIIKTERDEFSAEQPEISETSNIRATKKPKHLKFLWKRKYDSSEKQLKLLQLQVRNQEKLLAAIQMQSTATKVLADAATKQAESMAQIAESTQAIAATLKDAVKYLKKDEETKEINNFESTQAIAATLKDAVKYLKKDEETKEINNFESTQAIAATLKDAVKYLKKDEETKEINNFESTQAIAATLKDAVKYLKKDEETKEINNFDLYPIFD